MNDKWRTRKLGENLFVPPAYAYQNECGGQQGNKKELDKHGECTTAKAEKGWDALDGGRVG